MQRGYAAEEELERLATMLRGMRERGEEAPVSVSGSGNGDDDCVNGDSDRDRDAAVQGVEVEEEEREGEEHNNKAIKANKDNKENKNNEDNRHLIYLMTVWRKASGGGGQNKFRTILTPAQAALKKRAALRVLQLFAGTHMRI